MFAYHVLTDVSGARDVNNICRSQMRLLPLPLMERIRRIWEGSAGFHTHARTTFPLPFSYIFYSLINI